MSVSVLAPNGRRQTVKCSPNSTIFQILEEVCKKQGFKVEEHDLKHHNKVLDTTQLFRFSGLPNNAQLELVPAQKTRQESDITLAINLEDGSRLIGTFKSSDTLQQVLNTLCPEKADLEQNPVIIYTRREIYGEELAKTTLKNLGLTGGRAMVRLVHKKPEELKQQANVSAPLPAKPVQEKPYKRVFQKIEESEKPTVPKIIEDDIKNEIKEIESEKSPKPKVQKNNTIDLIKLAKEKNKDQIKKHPTIKGKDCNCAQELTVPLECNSQCQTNCVKENEEKVEEEFVFLGTRNAMLFSLETAQAIPSEDLPDDFFELTINDAKKILKDVKRKRAELENQQLLTSTLRNLEKSKSELRSLNKYKKTIIRIQFPNRTVLQGTFSPIDTITDVLDFIREYLEDKNLDFYVYTTPPKSVLKADTRLLDNGCVPGAMLYFGTNEAAKREHYLREDLRNKFTTSSMASIAALKMRRAGTRACIDIEESVEDMEVVANDDPGPSTSAPLPLPEYTGRRIEPTTENIPKWFKLSK